MGQKQDRHFQAGGVLGTQHAAAGGSGSAAAAIEGGALDQGLAMSRSAFFGRMKKIMRYLFSGEPELWRSCEIILRCGSGSGTQN